MTGQLSDIVGHLFPTTQVGSYPRPRWNGFDLGGEDIRVALRRADFAEAFSDGVRAMIGDQVDAGIDVPTDGHLWYDGTRGSSPPSCSTRPTTWTASKCCPRPTPTC